MTMHFPDAVLFVLFAHTGTLTLSSSVRCCCEVDKTKIAVIRMEATAIVLVPHCLDTGYYTAPIKWAWAAFYSSNGG